MHGVLETSPNVTPLTKPKFEMGVIEGNACAPNGYRYLMGPHNLEANMLHIYNNPFNYDWRYIRKCWEANWFETNPYAMIKMQKTPTDVLRVQMIQEAFNDLYWIISVKNPYSYIASYVSKWSLRRQDFCKSMSGPVCQNISPLD